MKRKKLLFIVSGINKAISFEWTSIHLKEKFNLKFVLIGDPNSKLGQWLKQNSIAYFEINQQTAGISKWIHVYRILKKENPDVVHTHLWMANLIGLSGAWVVGIKKRIFTRHHAMIHYDEFPSGRKWDRLCNFLATDIVAISKNIQSILIERDKAKPEKIKVIHHGFDLGYFQSVDYNRILVLKSRYKLSQQDSPVIGVIARYIKWKGVEFVIEAFQKILNRYPNAKLVLANAHGPYSNYIKQKLKSLPDNSFIEIAFEDDLAALYHLFDAYVHVPCNLQSEAFGQTYVEALASGIPSVFTLSGVASEFIEHERNALVVPYCDSLKIYESILRILSEDNFKNELITNGRKSLDKFRLEIMINKLTALYDS